MGTQRPSAQQPQEPPTPGPGCRKPYLEPLVQLKSQSRLSLAHGGLNHILQPISGWEIGVSDWLSRDHVIHMGVGPCPLEAPS